MLLLPALLSFVVTAEPRKVVSEVACETVAQCWMDENGKPIARPKKLEGKSLPRGDCGRKLLWLRNRLTCDQRLCTVTYIGDKC